MSKEEKLTNKEIQKLKSLLRNDYEIRFSPETDGWIIIYLGDKQICFTQNPHEAVSVCTNLIKAIKRLK